MRIKLNFLTIWNLSAHGPGLSRPQNRMLVFVILALILSILGGVPSCAEAAKTVVTVAGTVISGVDIGSNGACVFCTGTSNLQGQPYTLVFTFDSSRTKEIISNDANGAPVTSSIAGIGKSSPGTAILTIHGVSVKLGSTYTDVNSAAVKSIASANPILAFDVTDSDDSGSNARSAAVNIYPAPGSLLLSDFNWDAPISYTVSDADQVKAAFDYAQALSPTNPNMILEAGGQLGVTSLSISAPPTTLELAEMSADVYNPTGSAIDAFTPLLFNINDQYGLAVRAWISPDHSQIAVAFRGTYANTNSVALKNAAADTSFIDGVPSTFLSGATKEASQFLNQLSFVYPNANITLTGHSLGGAVAQIFGATTGWDTSVFNAPGAGSFLSLASSTKTSGLGTDINYRIYGDQVSLSGVPIGTSITLPKPSDVLFPLPVSSGSSDDVLVISFAANYDGFLTVHQISTVISQIKLYGTTGVSMAGEPNFVAIIESALYPQNMSVDTVTNITKLEFDFVLLASGAQVSRLFDPSSGVKFVFSVSGESPSISCLTLPSVPGVSSYYVRSQTNGVWGAFVQIKPGVETCFGSGTTSVEFDPVDGKSVSVTISDQFYFGVKFAQAGTVNATLQEYPTASSFVVPAQTTPPVSGGGGCSAFGGSLDGKGPAGDLPFDPTLVIVISASWLWRRYRR